MTLRESERARSFGTNAHDYDRLRSSPPTAAVDWLVGTGVRSAVELGAGTGLFSRILAERIPEVLAVEPDHRMREVFETVVPGVPVRAGTAEEIPAADASVDAVFCSNAWHWFDPERAFAEIDRVLRPGGRVGVFWNAADRTVPWVAELFEVIFWGNDGPRSPGRFALPDNAELAARFTRPERHDVPWSRALTPDDVIGLLGTYSPVLALSDSDREAFFARSREYLRTHPELSGRELIDVPYRAVCWLTRRADDPAADGHVPNP